MTSRADMLRIDHAERRARIRCLERAYPLLKQAAEILELEALEPFARTAKRLRQDIGAELADLGEPTNEFEFERRV